MKKLKLCETKKLHYGKYLYKLVLANRLNSIFRSELQKEGNLSFARNQLDILTENYRQGIPLEEKRYRATREIPIDHYLDAKDVYTILKETDDYKVRVDPWQSLIIYSNDRNNLLKIANKVRESAREFWEPNPETIDFLKQNENIILVDSPSPYLYKVTLGRGRYSTKELGEWLLKNTDKSKVGPTAIDCFLNNTWSDGLYFYVRDKKVLMLVQLMVGNNIRRLDKLVYKGNIDK